MSVVKFTISGLIRCPTCSFVWWLLGKDKHMNAIKHNITLGEYYSRIYGFNRSANSDSGNHAVNCPRCGFHLIVEPILTEPCPECSHIWGYHHFKWFKDKLWERLSYCPCTGICIIRNIKGATLAFSDEIVFNIHKHRTRILKNIKQFNTIKELEDYQINELRDITLLDEDDPSFTEHLISTPTGSKVLLGARQDYTTDAQYEEIYYGRRDAVSNTP